MTQTFLQELMSPSSKHIIRTNGLHNEITGRHSGELAENLQVSLQSNATQQWLKLPADIQST